MKKICIYAAIALFIGCKNCDELEFYIHPQTNEINAPLLEPGNTFICYPNSETLSISNLGNQLVEWQVSNNLRIVNATNNRIEITTIASDYGTGVVSARLSDGTEFTEHLILNGSIHKAMFLEVKRTGESTVDVQIREGSGVIPYEVYVNNEYAFSTNSRQFQLTTIESSGRIEVRNANLCGSELNRAYFTGLWNKNK